MPQVYHYTVILEREEDGGFHAYCPTLPGCHTQGESLEEALSNIQEAILAYLESLNCRYGANGDYVTCLVEGDRLVLRKVTAYSPASFEDGIWSLIGTLHDREDRTDVSANKHRYLGEKP
ncbi:MAG: type II toxin-antitoxin system HicB family antitoxin [Clostridia bacterium]|nr:MAG: type II toxin-antitoxin system HicB family antitoxin [Clostridia bacterium]